MIIFNEKKYVEDIIESKKKPQNMVMKRLIVYLCKYYYGTTGCDKPKKFQQFILARLKEFHFPQVEYEEYRYSNYVFTICQKLLKNELDHQLREIDTVGITQKELDIIESLENDQEKKLLFTFYALAKTYINPTGWVNYTEKDIFKLANIDLNQKDKMLLIRKLYNHGVLEYNHVIDKSGYKVELDNGNDFVIEVNVNANIGNQLMVFINQDYMICENCGRIVKRTKNVQKYCKACYKKINLQQRIDWQEKNIVNHL